MKINRCLNCMESFGEGQVCPHCGFDNAGYQAVPYALRPNTILRGKYLMGRMLGQGGFGITYIGFDLSLGVKVAVKEYFPMNQGFRDCAISNEVQMTTTMMTDGQWQDGCEAFLKEARRMAKISTVPELVGVRETFGENNTAYIVMDYVEGLTLKDWLPKNGHMDFKGCVELFLPLMEGLEKVHSQGLIHRDISPDNIMIQPDGKPRLLDLGAAKDLNAGSNGASQLVARHGFSPPEQYRERGEIGPWTDVYALCATMYYCITGKAVPGALDRMDRDGLVFPETLTKQQTYVLAAGMALEKNKRIQTVSVLMEQLRAAVDGEIGGKIPVKKVRRLSGTVTAAAALAAVLVIGVLVQGIYRMTHTETEPALEPAISAETAEPIAAETAEPVVEEPTKVEVLGCTNSNFFQHSPYAEIPGKYSYYVDRDGKLYVSPYDQEESAFLIGTERPAVDDDALFINIGSDKVYFIHNDETEESGYQKSLMQMDFDGGNVELLLNDGDYMGMQYVRLTDGKEYLYYLKEDENPDDLRWTLCRFDLEQRTTQTLLEEIFSFSLYGDRIFYTIVSIQNINESVWKCAGLDGQDEKILNDSDSLVYGYVEDGAAYMYSLKEDMLYQYDLEGRKTGNSMLMSIVDCSLYGDGWLYYSRENSNEVHRVRPDGTYDEVIFEGSNISLMCYANSKLWMLQTKNVGGETVNEQTFLIYKDGSSIIPIEGAYTDMMPEGLEYRIENDAIVLIDYTGDESRIVIPWEVDRKTIIDIRRQTSFPKAVDIYVYPQKDELTYELTEDGTGIILTACGGGKTDGYPFIALPAEIDGLPLVKLGNELFEENASIQGIILPEGLETIGDSAFESAVGLSYVQLPDTLKSIGNNAFINTGSLSGIILPEGLQEIGQDAFAVGGLRTVCLPSTLNSMIANPFCNAALESIVLAEGLQGYILRDGAVYVNNAIRIVPAKTWGAFYVADGTKRVAAEAFFGTNVTKVYLPAGIEAIYQQAFMHAKKLESIYMEEGVEVIAAQAFYKCSSLREITIPQSVKEIGERAFYGCDSLQEVTVSSDCVIAEDAFDEGVRINYY